jgi:uncharacterized protein YaiI (UPF0178 family)
VNIWVDADACPVAIKEILFRAAQRLGIPLTLVANRLLRVPPSPHIRAVQVPGGFDVADKHIAQAVQAISRWPPRRSTRGATPSTCGASSTARKTSGNA